MENSTDTNTDLLCSARITWRALRGEPLTWVQRQLISEENRVRYVQDVAERYTRGRVLACCSGLVDTLARAAQLDDGHDLESLLDAFMSRTIECETCEGACETECPEIFEWWIVDDRMASALGDEGETVLEPHTIGIAAYVWGRSCTGQAISLDSVVESIALDYYDLPSPSDIYQIMLRTVWANAWASEWENAIEDGRADRVPWPARTDLLEFAPECSDPDLPRAVYSMISDIERTSRAGLPVLWLRCCAAVGYQIPVEDWAHAVATQAMGCGVAWTDDHHIHRSDRRIVAGMWERCCYPDALGGRDDLDEIVKFPVHDLEVQLSVDVTEIGQ